MPVNSRNRIALNAVSSAIQVIIVGLVYFFIYRSLVVKLGIELLGVWSLIIAVSSVSAISNFGFSSAVVKYIAEYNVKGEFDAINRLLFTSMFFMISVFVVIAVIIYFSAFLLIGKLIDIQYIKIAHAILPISLMFLFINTIGGVLTSALDGFQKNYIRNFAISAISIGYLALTLLLIPKLGLVGLAVAQVIQSLALFIVSYYFLRRICKGFSIFRWNWDRSSFRILINYGYKIQIINICQILTEPVTKILLSKYHGISTLGFYEMASRLINQLRQIIAGMNQVTVPVVSHFQQTDRSTIRYIYERGLSFIVFIVFPLFAGIILFTPHLSKIWIGNIEPVFIACTYILASGMLINILDAQAYFNSLGEGNLNGVMLMSLLVLLLNIVLGVFLGLTVPVYGVVIANALASAAGSVYLIIYYQKLNKIKYAGLLKASDKITITAGLLFSVLSVLFLLKLGEKMNFNIKSLVIFMVIYVVFFIPVVLNNRNFEFSGTLLRFFKRE
jgi:O-antigen/teichoic acid export membrane protein